MVAGSNPVKCVSITCGLNQRVFNHTCKSCDSSKKEINAAGDHASGPDTQCEQACDFGVAGFLKIVKGGNSGTCTGVAHTVH